MASIDLINKHLAFVINEQSKVNHAANELAKHLRYYFFSKNFISDAMIIANELGTNLLKHGTNRKILLFRILKDEHSKGLEITSCDGGSLIESIQQAIEDGFSTQGTLGYGLGAIQRLSDSLEYQHIPTFGNIFIAKKYNKEPTEYSFQEYVDWVCTPLEGETISGDATTTIKVTNGFKTIVSDGLGHGEAAEEASSMAIDTFKNNAAASIEVIFEQLHQALKKSRGAAIAIAEVNHEACELVFAGIGNVAGRIYRDTDSKGLASKPGIVGVNFKKINPVTLPFRKGQILAMHSDGVRTLPLHHEMQALVNFSPNIMSLGLYLKLLRERDDACVVVFKN